MNRPTTLTLHLSAIGLLGLALLPIPGLAQRAYDPMRETRQAETRQRHALAIQERAPRSYLSSRSYAAYSRPAPTPPYLLIVVLFAALAGGNLFLFRKSRRNIMEPKLVSRTAHRAGITAAIFIPAVWACVCAAKDVNSDAYSIILALIPAAYIFCRLVGWIVNGFHAPLPTPEEQQLRKQAWSAKLHKFSINAGKALLALVGICLLCLAIIGVFQWFDKPPAFNPDAYLAQKNPADPYATVAQSAPQTDPFADIVKATSTNVWPGKIEAPSKEIARGALVQTLKGVYGIMDVEQIVADRTHFIPWVDADPRRKSALDSDDPARIAAVLRAWKSIQKTP